MTDKLALYNLALLKCSERPLANLSENTKARRVLDQAYDAGAGFLPTVLEKGLWNFAMRTMETNYTADIEPDFGFRRPFTKPTDFVRTAAICEDEYFDTPLLRYADEHDYWFADVDVIYVKYISSRDDYGGDFGRWPPSFVEACGCFLAMRAAHGFNKTKGEIEALQKADKAAWIEARGRDAMADATQFTPTGNWMRSRRRYSSSFERGNRHRLHG